MANHFPPARGSREGGGPRALRCEMAPRRNRGLGVKWAPVERVDTVVPTTAVAEDTQEPHADTADAASDATSLVSCSTAVGDSLHSEEGEEDEGEEAAAGAAGSGDRPPKTSTRRKQRPRRETAPIAAWRHTHIWAAVAKNRDEDERVGNIGWMFGNWGKRPASPKMKAHVDMALKRNPAMIIGLAECQTKPRASWKHLDLRVTPPLP